MVNERKDCQETFQPEGKYANYFKVGHNALEFVIDFGQFYADKEQARAFTRLILNPVLAKNFLEVLQMSVSQYEESFGHITEHYGSEPTKQ